MTITTSRKESKKKKPLTTKSILNSGDYQELKEYKQKQMEILDSIKLVDVQELKNLAIKKGGLLNKKNRSRVWPLLLKVNHIPKLSYDKNIKSPFDEQIKLDVERSFTQFNQDITSSEREVLKKQLEVLLIKLFKMEPLLNYYQGFHDIASVILLNLGPKNSIKSIYHLSYYYLLDYMGIDLIPVKKQLNCLFELLKLKDQQLYNFITDLEIPNYFALSWLITWGCHDIKDWNLCSRLLDFYLATSPEMPIYLACVLILHYRNEILNLEPDMPIVHTYLTNLMKNITNSNNDNNNIIDIEELISKTSLLYQQLPFDQLINNNYNELILNQNSAILNFNEFLSLSSKQEFILNYSILKNRLLIGFNQYNKQQLQSNTTLTITLVLLAMMVGAYYTSNVV